MALRYMPPPGRLAITVLPSTGARVMSIEVWEAGDEFRVELHTMTREHSAGWQEHVEEDVSTAWELAVARLVAGKWGVEVDPILESVGRQLAARNPFAAAMAELAC